MPTHQVKELINRNDLRNLLLHDQLNKQIELKKVLQVTYDLYKIPKYFINNKGSHV